jgi:hypothetical protein
VCFVFVQLRENTFEKIEGLDELKNLVRLSVSDVCMCCWLLWIILWERELYDGVFVLCEWFLLLFKFQIDKNLLDEQLSNVVRIFFISPLSLYVYLDVYYTLCLVSNDKHVCFASCRTCGQQFIDRASIKKIKKERIVLWYSMPLSNDYNL